jgi:hypothetical protein
MMDETDSTCSPHEEDKCAHNFNWRTSRGKKRDYFGDLGVDGKIILKLLRVQTSCRFL